MSYAKLDMTDRINEENSDEMANSHNDESTEKVQQSHRDSLPSSTRAKKISVVSTDSEFESAVINTDMTTASVSRHPGYGGE